MTTKLGFRDRIILELLYGTGIRSQELRGIRVEDVDTKQQQLYVREGKGDKDRLVPLGPGLCELIDHYLAFVRNQFLERFGNNVYLLVGGKKGMALCQTTLGHIIREHAKNVGIKRSISPHSFRHACATHMMQNGAPIRHVQELLGHDNINSTQVYTHLTITDLKKAHTKYHPREKIKNNEEEREEKRVPPP